MAEPRKYTRQTVGQYYDPELKTNGVQVTAWTDDAWNRAQEANRRYQADQEWQRAHPYLAKMRNFAGRVASGVGNFINDEIFLNKGNVRVKNAQAHPEVMDAIQSGGNIAGGLIAAPFIAGAALETAPTWAPWLVKGMASKGVLAAETAGTLGMTANQWLPWLLGSTGAVVTIPASQYIAENGVPSISLPQSGSTTMATATTPADSIGTAPAQPAPANTTRTAAPGTTAPAPQPERNNSTSQGRRPSFRERLGDRIAGRSSGQATGNSGGATPPNNNQNGSFLGRMLWETKNNNFGQNYWQWRNVGRVGLGLSYPAREHLWPAVGSAGKYMIMGPDSIPATPTPATSNTPSVPADGGYVAKDQYIAPTDTLDF